MAVADIKSNVGATRASLTFICDTYSASQPAERAKDRSPLRKRWVKESSKIARKPRRGERTELCRDFTSPPGFALSGKIASEGFHLVVISFAPTGLGGGGGRFPHGLRHGLRSYAGFAGFGEIRASVVSAVPTVGFSNSRYRYGNRTLST